VVIFHGVYAVPLDNGDGHPRSCQTAHQPRPVSTEHDCFVVATDQWIYATCRSAILLLAIVLYTPGARSLKSE
jgi:hypothetical protein